jgi:hypothetical protein
MCLSVVEEKIKPELSGEGYQIFVKKYLDR